MDDSAPIELPVNGILDLHTFQPCDIKELVPDYIVSCLKQGILQVRIIHGKGVGALQRTVHSILRRIPEALSFHSAGENEGGWGATVVILKTEGTVKNNEL